MAGYSGKPVFQKLGIKPGQKIKVLHPPKAYATLVGLTEVEDTAAQQGLDFIHLFIHTEEQLWRHLPELKAQLQPAGMIWVSWPKKTSRLFQGLTEDLIRHAATNLELVDVKVCAIDEVWSALKLVIPVTKRPHKT